MKNDLLRLLIMVAKRTIYGFVVLLVCMTALLANEGVAQYESLRDITISVKLRDASLEDAIKTIESETSLSFTFEERDLLRRKGINVKARNKALDLILLEIARDADVEFKQVNNNIHVKAVSRNAKAKQIEVIQGRTVTGTVLSSEDNSALPGVNVIVKGTSTGTVTNIDGNYSLNVPEDGTSLVFSSVGFVTQEVAIGTQTVIDLTLAADVTALEEIVVVGYGTQQKVNLTGAVGVAKGEVLESRPIVNVGNGLQGVIPNLNITIRNGDPADARTDFNIRGYESINGGNPLILVDGVPMDINRLNPNDIENISVLKDAAASAVYGARAAFGVILVETKKGKQGDKINLSFNAEFAAAKPIMFIDPITDPYQYVLARDLATYRTNGNGFDQDYLDGTKRWSENPTEENAWGVYNGQLRFYGYNEYQDKIITDFAPQQKYDFNISGATDKASYYVSFGYLSKDGYLKNKDKNEKFTRYNILTKGDFEINKWLRMDSRAMASIEDSDKPHFYNWDVNINTTARVNPINPLTFPDLPYYQTPGDREEYEQYIGMHFQSVNFLPYLEQGGRDTFTRNNLILTQGVTLNPLKGLNIRGEFSANFTNINDQDVRSKVNVIENQDLNALNIVEGFSNPDYINNRSDNDQYYVFNTYADYTIDNDNGHFLKAMVGFNQEWGRFQYIRSRAFSLITPQIADLNATTGNQETYGGKEEVALRGVFYRVNYIFKDRYLLEANGRYDGTSRFPEDDRFGFFPSFSVGWRISNESFMSGTANWLDNLKIRASFGTLGNQLLFDEDNNPIYYPYIPTMGSGTSPYMMSGGSRTPFVSPAGLVSPSLTWETVVTRNIGLDFTMLNSRLDVSFDVYTRDTKDMLTDVTYPEILGTSAPQANAADLRTSGWELAATWKDRINTDWNYGVTLAFSDNVSEITKYDNPTGSIDEYYVGYRIGDRWGYETYGIFQTEEEVLNAPDQSEVPDGANWRPGDIRYADLDGDNAITQGERTLEDHGDLKIIANEEPRYNFGLNGNLGWKGLTLNLFFQGTLKYQYWPPNNNWVAFYPFNAGHVEWYYVTDTWSEDNRGAYFPHPHISTNTKQNVQPQSRYVQNAAYIRLKNLTLAYTLPPEISRKIGMVSTRIYFAGENLWEATKMRKPLDPEVRPTLTQEYYKQRIYSLGLNITF
ncbi:MAG: TonB-dependent receptor [Cytophagales bacterium]|nr:TonB-dependent receptor [Cytophagales bacterium]